MPTKNSDLPKSKAEPKIRRCWVITPTYNDHDSTLILIHEISKLETKLYFNVVVIDDASTLVTEQLDLIKDFQRQGRIEKYFYYELEQNLGNQGAIAFGLKKALKMADDDDLFVVMDSDGEDKPEDILEMINVYKAGEIVVARRAKEKSHFILMLWHRLFKFALKELTGKNLNFGNFSLMGYTSCKRLVLNKRIDLSYVGCILQSEIELNRVKLHRGKRYMGASKTSRDGLLIWGFQILSVFSEKIFAKLFRLSVIFGVTSIFGISLIMYLKLFTNVTIPGWSGVMIAILSTSMLQLVVMLSGFIMIQSHAKTNQASSVLGE